MFVRLVSHEIRTPLNIVVGGLELLSKHLKNHVEDPEMSEIILDCRCSCDAAVDILSDMLTYEKLDGGAMKLEKTPIPIWNFIDTSTRPFQIQVRFMLVGHLCVNYFVLYW